MNRSLLAAGVALCIGLMFVSGTPTAAQPPEEDAKAKAAAVDDKQVQQVQDAIERGIKYLRKTQGKGGNWESFLFDSIADKKGGLTALATLALLNCKLKPGDPTIDNALKYLENLEPTSTYVRGLQSMAFAETRLEKYKPKIEANVRWFEANASRDADGNFSGWGYPSKFADNSNTQYALLGLYAAKTAGVKVDDALWRKVLDFYTRTQEKDGWKYRHLEGLRPSFSMSVSGVCGLLIAQMGLDQSAQGLDDRTGVAANCGQYAQDDALAKGMRWVAGNFNFLEGKSYLYNYYGIERLGRLSGQKFIGKFDWYRQGCTNLVKMQVPVGDNAGAFLCRDPHPAGTDVGVDDTPIIATSFALLFLSKGRTPVLITKYAWGNIERAANAEPRLIVELGRDGRETSRPDWNRKHNDARHLVEFTAREVFENQPLSWQVYDSRLRGLDRNVDQTDIEVGELLQSPVLYLNGHGALTFVDTRAGAELGPEEKLLQRYVESGGFLLAEACCGDKEFARSFDLLVERIMPKSELKPIPATHAIWTMFPGVSKADFPDLQYVDRGCRTVAVFSPSPLAGYWEEQRFMPSPVDARDPKNKGQKAYCLARNIIAYATGMELPKPKLTFTKLPKDKVEDAAGTRSKFRALQLQYGGAEGAETAPAPGALKNLMASLEQRAKLDVTQNTAVMLPNNDHLAKYKFMYMHGRKPVAFDTTSSDNIKGNLQGGGLLLADASCNGFDAWKKFDASFRKAMKDMWGEDLMVIPTTTADGKDEPLYKIAKDAGINLRSVKCRREKVDGSGPEPELRDYPALLEGIKDKDGRWLVVYSKYDIGCAIEGHKAADCLGHDKESALNIASAVVLYSLKR